MLQRWKCWTTQAGKHWPGVRSLLPEQASRSATTTLNMAIVLASVNTWKYRTGLNRTQRQDRNLPGSSASRARARRWSVLALAGSGKPFRNGDMSRGWKSDDSLRLKPRAAMDFHQRSIALEECRSVSCTKGGRDSQTSVSH